MTVIIEIAVADLVRPLRRPFVTALRRTSEVRSVAVRLTTADGNVGYAEAPQIWRVTGESQASITACVLGPLADFLLGRELDAASVSTLHQDLARQVAGNTGARAACEIAAVDLLARASGRSQTEFLGGQAAEVASDITIAAQVDEPAGELLPAGFRTAKIKVGLDPADGERVVRFHRESGARIRIDANQAWDVATAIATVEAWLAADVDLEFVEQPLPAWDIAGHSELRRRLDVPIMLDESVFDAHDLDRVIAAEAADLVNIKLAKCGGFYAGLEMASTATAAGLGVMVGSMMESELGVGAAAALAGTVAASQTHDLDAAWWSITGSDPSDSPYRGDRFDVTMSSQRSRRLGALVDRLHPWQVRKLQ